MLLFNLTDNDIDCSIHNDMISSCISNKYVFEIFHYSFKKAIELTLKTLTLYGKISIRSNALLNNVILQSVVFFVLNIILHFILFLLNTSKNLSKAYNLDSIIGGLQIN